MVGAGGCDDQKTLEAVNHSYQETLAVEGAGGEVSHAWRESPQEVNVEEHHGRRWGTLREEVEGAGKTENRKEGLLAVDVGSRQVVVEEVVKRHCRWAVHRAGGGLVA